MSLKIIALLKNFLRSIFYFKFDLQCKEKESFVQLMKSNPNALEIVKIKKI